MQIYFIFAFHVTPIFGGSGMSANKKGGLSPPVLNPVQQGVALVL